MLSFAGAVFPERVKLSQGASGALTSDTAMPVSGVVPLAVMSTS
jgi:hypothetical protein